MGMSPPISVVLVAMSTSAVEKLEQPAITGQETRVNGVVCSNASWFITGQSAIDSHRGRLSCSGIK